MHLVDFTQNLLILGYFTCRDSMTLFSHSYSHRDLTALPNKPASAAMCAAIHRGLGQPICCRWPGLPGARPPGIHEQDVSVLVLCAHLVIRAGCVRAVVFSQRTKLLALCACDRALCSVMLAVVCAQAYCWFVVLVAGEQLRHRFVPGTRNKLPGGNNLQRTARK